MLNGIFRKLLGLTMATVVAYVLDDDASIGTLVARMLSSIGYYAVPFVEMHECIKRIKEASEYSKPSLIVLDLALGKHDAIDVFDQLQKVGYEGRLLLMSASMRAR